MLGLHFGKPQDLTKSKKPAEKSEKPHFDILHPFSKMPAADPVAKNGSHDDDAGSVIHRMMPSVPFEETNIGKTITAMRGILIADFDDVNDIYINEMSIENFIDYLNKERLVSMPHRGSRWDRALRCAEYFALQLTSYAQALEDFTPEAVDGLYVALASCRLLLQLGQDNDKALEDTFSVFYKIGLGLQFLVKHSHYFSSERAIQREVQQAYSTLIDLVTRVAQSYRIRVKTMIGRSTSFNFYATFSSSIDSFHDQKERIADMMWTHALKQEKCESNVTVNTIRRWLEPPDSVLKLMMTDRLAAKAHRAEFTCEWFQSHLIDFFKSNDQTLSVVGPTGTGKSVLAAWIEERLQRPLGRKSYETIEYKFDFDLPTESTRLACLKSLIRQMLQQNVGNSAFFTALVNAYNAYIKTGKTIQLETDLANALEIALKSYKGDDSAKLVIIIDGLEKISGGDSFAPVFAKEIMRFATKYDAVKAIVLARSKYTGGNAKDVKEFGLTIAQTHEDIRRMVRELLQQYESFNKLPADQEHKLLEQFADHAKGSFLWAELVAKKILSGSTTDFSKALADVPKNLTELMDKLLDKVHLKQSEVKLALGWMLAARRPLTVNELGFLLRIDLHHNIVSDKKTDIIKFTRECFGLILVVESSSVVRFRHSAIRQHLLSHSLKNGRLPPIQDAQTDLLLRLLLFAKTCFSEEDPSCEMPSIKDIDRISSRHGLLEYCTSYWIIHLEKTPMYQSEKLELTEQFKAVFPTSPMMAMCEWVRWTTSFTIRGALDLFNLCLRVRKGCFGEKHVTILQTLIILSTVRRGCGDYDESCDLIYKACQQAQSVCSQYSSIAIKCTNLYLEYTSTCKETKRTETVTRREECMKYCVTASEHHEGKECQTSIEYSKRLMELYMQVEESEKASGYYEIIRGCLIRRYGRHSREVGELEELMIELKRGTKPKDITPSCFSIFALYEDEYEITDLSMIIIRLELARSYELKGEWYMAEEIYISLWTKVVALCRVGISIEYHLAKIDCALAYVRFLIGRTRMEEACAMLICIWAEYEHEVCDSEALILRLRICGQLVRQCGMYETALSVFKKVWNYYERYEKTTSEEARSCSTEMSSCIEETIEKKTSTTTTTTTTATTTTTEETVKTVREFYKKQVETCKTTKDWRQIITSCKSLVHYHHKEQSWSEAITCISSSLELIWKVILTGHGEFYFPVECVEESIFLAIKLALSYTKEHRFEDAERIYLRIYWCAIGSCSMDDGKVQEAIELLIRFYEENHRHEKTIALYGELLARYRSCFGARHRLVIKTLYALSDLLYKFGHNSCYDYYLEICTILNQDLRFCHKDAVTAAVVLLRYYSRSMKWINLRGICELLWGCFVHHHAEYNLSIDIIRLIYKSYALVLEVHLKVEFEIRRKLALEFRECCHKYYSEHHELYIDSTYYYASVCEQHEKYHSEAISCYEEVITKSKTTSTSTTTTSTSTTSESETKKKLTQLYVKSCSSSSTTTSTTTIERAVSLSIERYEECRVKYGCHHETSIIALRDICLLYKQIKGCRHKIFGKLHACVIEIIATQKSAMALYRSGMAIARLYLEFGCVEEGMDLLADLQAVILEYEHTSKCKLKIHKHFGRISYVFMVAFELTLRQTISVTFMEIMVDLLTEFTLFQQYHQVIKRKEKIEIILVTAARLRQFLFIRSRAYQCTLVEKQTFELFLKAYGGSVKSSKEITYEFFICLLADLADKKTHVIRAACSVGAKRVESLIVKGEYVRAYDVACCVWQLTSSNDAYDDPRNVGWGLKLVECLNDVSVTDEKLQAQMLDLSKLALVHIINACRDNGVNFVRLPVSNLESLVRLLGNHKNFERLDWLLGQLWDSREAQKIWKQDDIIGTGRCLVNAKFALDKREKAISLCEDIVYNLRRARGSTDMTTLHFYSLYTNLLSSAGRLEEALTVHLEVLKLIADGQDNDDFDKEDYNEKAMGEVANKHSRRLKLTCQRLKGYNDKKELIVAVVKELREKFTLDVDYVSNWDKSLNTKPTTDEGLWKIPVKWTMKMDVQGSNKRFEPRKQFKRLPSGYGSITGRSASGSVSTTRPTGPGHVHDHPGFSNGRLAPPSGTYDLPGKLRHPGPGFGFGSGDRTDDEDPWKRYLPTPGGRYDNDYGITPGKEYGGAPNGYNGFSPNKPSGSYHNGGYFPEPLGDGFRTASGSDHGVYPRLSKSQPMYEHDPRSPKGLNENDGAPVAFPVI